MKITMALVRNNLRLASREKGMLAFGLLFPLGMFFVFTKLIGMGKTGEISYVVTMTIMLGLIMSMMGSGAPIIAGREMNILRRFKAAPITPAHFLFATLLTAWILYLPTVLILLVVAHFGYGMEMPRHVASLMMFITLGYFTFQSLGFIIACVSNTAQESALVGQLLFLPMMFLSGFTLPLTFLPEWAQILSQFLPGAHLQLGFQGIFFRNESLMQNGASCLALLVTMLISLFISVQMFRWEKEERLPSRARLWVLAALSPFLLLGGYQAHSRSNLRKTQELWRSQARSQTTYIHGARLFLGDGRVIESGSVLVKDGKIVEVYPGGGPDPKTVRANVIEGGGKTLLPGLIDVHVHLGAPGGVVEPPTPQEQKAGASAYDFKRAMAHALKSYLYCGVTTVRSVGDGLDSSLELRDKVNSGDLLGAELYACGPLFTAAGGYGTQGIEMAKLSGPMKMMTESQFLREPKTPEEARKAVQELKAQGVDGIKAVLEAGSAGQPMNRMNPAVFQAVVEEARAEHLPVAAHTGDSQDVTEALKGPVSSIEQGSIREALSVDTLAQMKRGGVSYDPTLSVSDALDEFRQGKESGLIDRPLVQEVGPEKLLRDTRKALASTKGDAARMALIGMAAASEEGKQNLLKVYRAGAPLVTGSDAGNLLVFHGPTVQREMELWVKAGIPPKVALLAATANAARLLHADGRIGQIKKGYDANLLLVDGNPLLDIAATEKISTVIFKGERVERWKLFEKE